MALSSITVSGRLTLTVSGRTLLSRGVAQGAIPATEPSGTTSQGVSHTTFPNPPVYYYYAYPGDQTGTPSGPEETASPGYYGFPANLGTGYVRAVGDGPDEFCVLRQSGNDAVYNIGASPLLHPAAGTPGRVSHNISGFAGVLYNGVYQICNPFFGTPTYGTGPGRNGFQSNPLWLIASTTPSYPASGAVTVTMPDFAVDLNPYVRVTWASNRGAKIPAGTLVELGAIFSDGTTFIYHTGTADANGATVWAATDYYMGKGGAALNVSGNYIRLTFPNSQVYDSRLSSSANAGVSASSVILTSAYAPDELSFASVTSGGVTYHYNVASGAGAPDASLCALILGIGVSGYTGATGGGTAPSGTGFRHDAFLRPSYLTAGSSGVALLTTKDAAHSWDSYTVTSGAAADASLLIDPLTNSFRALYTNTPSGSGSGVTASFFTATASKDGEQGDWSASASVTTLTGAFPVVAQHPQDSTRAACLTLDSGTLKAWVSYDTGATWNLLNASVATGLDFSSSGRAGLCWLGECLCAVYASGNNLLAKVSTDGGHTWPGSAVTAASSGPYSGVSCAGLLGTLYAMANTATATKVFTSGDLGAAWAATAADPTAQASGTALGFVPETGRLLVGTSLYSADNGATWNTD